MSETMSVTITEVEPRDDGVAVSCVWRHGAHEPRQMTAFMFERPESADEIRGMVTAWAIAAAQEDHWLRDLRNELMGDHWDISFELTEDPFGDETSETDARLARSSSIEKR